MAAPILQRMVGLVAVLLLVLVGAASSSSRSRAQSYDSQQRTTSWAPRQSRPSNLYGINENGSSVPLSTPRRLWIATSAREVDLASPPQLGVPLWLFNFLGLSTARLSHMFELDAPFKISLTHDGRVMHRLQVKFIFAYKGTYDRIFIYPTPEGMDTSVPHYVASFGRPPLETVSLQFLRLLEKARNAAGHAIPGESPFCPQRAREIVQRAVEESSEDPEQQDLLEANLNHAAGLFLMYNRSAGERASSSEEAPDPVTLWRCYRIFSRPLLAGRASKRAEGEGSGGQGSTSGESSVRQVTPLCAAFSPTDFFNLFEANHASKGEHHFLVLEALRDDNLMRQVKESASVLTPAILGISHYQVQLMWAMKFMLDAYSHEQWKEWLVARTSSFVDGAMMPRLKSAAELEAESREADMYTWLDVGTIVARRTPPHERIDASASLITTLGQGLLALMQPSPSARERSKSTGDVPNGWRVSGTFNGSDNGAGRWQSASDYAPQGARGSRLQGRPLLDEADRWDELTVTGPPVVQRDYCMPGITGRTALLQILLLMFAAGLQEESEQSMMEGLWISLADPDNMLLSREHSEHFYMRRMFLIAAPKFIRSWARRSYESSMANGGTPLDSLAVFYNFFPVVSGAMQVPPSIRIHAQKSLQAFLLTTDNILNLTGFTGTALTLQDALLGCGAEDRQCTHWTSPVPPKVAYPVITVEEAPTRAKCLFNAIWAVFSLRLEGRDDYIDLDTSMEHTPPMSSEIFEMVVNRCLQDNAPHVLNAFLSHVATFTGSSASESKYWIWTSRSAPVQEGRHAASSYARRLLRREYVSKLIRAIDARTGPLVLAQLLAFAEPHLISLPAQGQSPQIVTCISDLFDEAFTEEPADVCLARAPSGSLKDGSYDYGGVPYSREVWRPPLAVVTRSNSIELVRAYLLLRFSVPTTGSLPPERLEHLVPISDPFLKLTRIANAILISYCHGYDMVPAKWVSVESS